MRNSKVLEMLESNRIDELKNMLQDEIYEEALKSKPGAKKRYTAMKKYFGYNKQSRECLQKPCQIIFEGKDYISFTNSWSLIFTTEDYGEIEMFEDKDRYPDVTRLMHTSGDKREIDIHKVIAEAKSKGYKLTKSEVSFNYKYLMLYDGAYFKIGLLDSSFAIIDDGKPAIVYHESGTRRPLTIKNDIGYCMIMPVKYEGDPEENGITVIEVK
jgi:hypothetical protein